MNNPNQPNADRARLENLLRLYFRPLRPKDRLVNRHFLSKKWKKFIVDIEERYQQAIVPGRYLNLNNETDRLQQTYVNTRRQRILDVRYCFAEDVSFISSIVEGAMRELTQAVEDIEIFLRTATSIVDFLDDDD